MNKSKCKTVYDSQCNARAYNCYPQAGKNGIDRTLSRNSFFTIMVRSSLTPPTFRRSPIMDSACARAAALSDSTVPSGSYVSVAVRRAMKKYRGMLSFPLAELVKQRDPSGSMLLSTPVAA